MNHVTASLRDIGKHFARNFRAVDRMDVNAWADKYRELSKVANKRGGKWTSRCYQREPQAEMTNREVRSVCIVGAAQTFGKSELILNFTGRQIHLNPGPMMIVQPTDGLARRFSRKRLQPMLNDTPPLREIVAIQKSRNATNTVSAKEFPGGEVRTVGADTPTALCSDPERDVLIDEVDRCQKACGREGDVVTLAEARQEDFGEDAFSLFTSTPSGVRPRCKKIEAEPGGPDFIWGELEKEEAKNAESDDEVDRAQPEGVSKILILFAESDQRHWFCPCQKCGRSQTLKWRQVIWPKDRPQLARYVCEFKECLHPHTDEERVRMVEAGEWRATAPFDGRRGYFLNGVASLSKPQRGCVNKLHQMARDFLRAKRRGVQALKAWTNTFLCECFAEDAAQSVEGDKLYIRRESFGKLLPSKLCFITAGGDVHPDRIELQVIGWGDGEESWVLEYHVFLGDPTKPEIWEEVDKVLLKRFDHPLGVTLGIERCAFDTGNCTDHVYSFCRPRQLRGVHAVKGIKGFGMPVLNLPKKSGVRKVRVWLVAKNTALRTITARLAQEQPGPGYVHFRNDVEPMFGKEYFNQLSANQIIRVKRAGIEWEDFDPGKRRDEAMDTFVYALAALRRTEVDYPKVLKRLADQAKAAKELPKEEEEARFVSPFKGRGWQL